MRKVRILLFAFIALSISLGLYYYWQQNRKATDSSAATPNNSLNMSKKDLNIPSGVIAEAIKNKNWTDFSTRLIGAKSPSELETFLSQTIFSLDSSYVLPAEHHHIYTALLPILDKKDLILPRGTLLISKSFGKLTLTDDQKKNLEAKYKKLGWIEKAAWLDVSIEWNPTPKSTIKALNNLLIKGRSDLLNDYFYTLNKVTDKKVLAEQLALGKKKMKSFPQEQQRFITDQLAQLDRKLQTP